jgi:DNA-binding transcriptional LysR family regulator
VLIRQLEYLVALAQERHFARAAERCKISQPTLSLAVRQLEDELGVAIVERGNRFVGFTHEGEVVLEWSRRILSDAETLKQDLDALRGSLAGRLRLGVVPSAIAAMSTVTTAFARRHPQVVIDQAEMTSIDILRDLATFDLDAAISYVDNEPVGQVTVDPLYAESYVLVTPASSAVGDAETVTWTDAAKLPLCLLRRDMQNRRIIDGIFTQLGLAPTVGIEASSMISQFCYLQTGEWSSVLPENFARWLRPMPDLRVAALVEPDVRKHVGLLVADRNPLPPLVRAFREHVAAWPFK